MADRIIYEARRGLGCGTGAVLCVLALLIAAQCSSRDGGALPGTAVAVQTPEEQAARLTDCRRDLDRAMAISPSIRITAANRIEIDDRLWDEMMADAKRGLAATFACVAYDGKRLEELPTMEYAVVYGARSGRRLALATNVGVSLE